MAAGRNSCPNISYEAAAGGFETVLKLSVPSSAEPAEPEGHCFSVVCPEESSRLDRAAGIAAANGTFVGEEIIKDYMDACEAWGLPIHPGHPVVPGRFDIPALIVTGELDPVTPPQYGV